MSALPTSYPTLLATVGNAFTPSRSHTQRIKKIMNFTRTTLSIRLVQTTVEIDDETPTLPPFPAADTVETTGTDVSEPIRPLAKTTPLAASLRKLAV